MKREMFVEKLTYSDLLDMNGEYVLVDDIKYPKPPQFCKVVVANKVCTCETCGHEKPDKNPSVSLVNNEYSFDFNKDGLCIGGTFEVLKIINIV